MGELHLEVYLERMKREYNEVETVHRRWRTVRPSADWLNLITPTKTNGGSGQYGRVLGQMEPWTEEDFAFESKVVGGNIPREYIPSSKRASSK